MNAILEENSKCRINDCSEKWKERQKKLIDEIEDYIDDCKNNEIYRYQYENKCYFTCPNQTRSSINDELICIDINDESDYSFNSLTDENFSNENQETDINSNYKENDGNFENRDTDINIQNQENAGNNQIHESDINIRN